MSDHMKTRQEIIHLYSQNAELDKQWVDLDWLKQQISYLMRETDDDTMLVAYSNCLSLLEEKQQ